MQQVEGRIDVTHIFFVMLPYQNLCKNLIPQGLYTCVQENCTFMHMQQVEGRIDVTGQLQIVHLNPMHIYILSSFC